MIYKPEPGGRWPRRFVEVETGSGALVLVSGRKREEIPYASITGLDVFTNPDGRVEGVFLKVERKRLVSLKGYEDMDSLAADMEKRIPAGLARRFQGKPGSGTGRKLVAFLMVGAVLAGFLGIAAGFLYLMGKIGLGPLLGPLLFIASGIFMFRDNRYSGGIRGNRVAGVFMILLGVLFLCFKFLDLLNL